ncbi:MAG TPA: oligopeptide transporter, OPT family [Candidatus Acidoferrales bacterium]|nr:oligopeptide transporter, OPT family [Candidatus Acidoferrales bacterium]
MKNPTPPSHTPEFTLRAVALGALLGVVFGLVTVYVALEVGLNFSASIPIAVLSITVFKYLGRPSLLENNIVQTAGSAGESIAAGIVYTMPALLFLGYQLEVWRIFWLALIGGVLGVLFMIPLRRYLVVEEHGKLVYPEGTACAEILISGERGGKFARQVFLGLGVGLLYKLLMSGMQLWRSAIEWSSTALRGAVLSIDLSPELLGIGCLIGLPVARVLFAGSLMSSVVLVPLIYVFGERLAGPLFPSAVPIARMAPADIWSNYLRYVGAGAVITGGALLLFQALPTVIRSLGGNWRRWWQARQSVENSTERDMPLGYVALGSLAMLACLYVLLAWKINPGGSANLVSVLLVAVFGFFFVVVSARITGLMGSSANPISGITIAVVMLTCLLFVLAGWVGGPYEIVAVSIGAVVCVAASNAGTTAQDLKTGFLVGATPRSQQITLLVGVLTSVLLIGFTLTWLNGGNGAPTPVSPAAVPAVSRLVAGSVAYQGRSYRVYAVRPGAALPPGRYLVSPADGLIHYRETQRIGTPQLPAPQAQVMAILVQGLLNHQMRWRLLWVGIAIALVVELCGVRSLPFAVGMYLPLSATAAMLVGALIARFAAPRAGEPAADAFNPGLLYSSGLIAGGAITAIAITALAGAGLLAGIGLAERLGFAFLKSAPWALLFYGGLCWLLWRENRKRH